MSSRTPASGSRSTRRATRPSARSSPGTSRVRCDIGSAHRGTSSSASRSSWATARSRTRAARSSRTSRATTSHGSCADPTAGWRSSHAPASACTRSRRRPGHCGRDLRRRTRRRRAPPLAAPAERARRPPSRPRRRALRGLRARRRGPGGRSARARRRSRGGLVGLGRVAVAPGDRGAACSGSRRESSRARSPVSTRRWSAPPPASPTRRRASRASDATAAWQPLVDRIAAELDPRGVLAA